MKCTFLFIIFWFSIEINFFMSPAAGVPFRIGFQKLLKKTDEQNIELYNAFERLTMAFAEWDDTWSILFYWVAIPFFCNRNEVQHLPFFGNYTEFNRFGKDCLLRNAQINIQWALCAIIHQKQMPDNLQLLFILILSDVRYQLKMCIFPSFMQYSYDYLFWMNKNNRSIHEWVSQWVSKNSNWNILSTFALFRSYLEMWFQKCS